MPLDRPAVVYTVALNGAPTRDLKVVRVDRTFGGLRLDSALLAVDLGNEQRRKGNRRGEHLQDLFLHRLDVIAGGAGLMNASIEIYATINGRVEVIHWGKLDLNQITLDEETEALHVVSRFQRFHFGRPLGYQRVLDPLTGQLVYLDEEVVFNPEVDGVAVGNRRVSVGTLSLGVTRPLFVHPESIRTPRAAVVQGAEQISLSEPDTFGFWDLPTAVEYLCAECNPTERHVLNPAPAAVGQVLRNGPIGRILGRGRNGQQRLAGSRIAFGVYLPEALDALLEPYGYTWFVEYLGVGQRQIAIVRKGYGPVVNVQHQRVGELLNPTRTDAARLRVDFDAAALANKIRITGDFTQVEATFPLIPGWDPAYDSTPFQRLSRTHPDWDNSPHLHRVGRDFVLGEGGDYVGARSWITEPFNLTALFRAVFGAGHPEIVPRRRRFLPTLTTKHEPGYDTGAEQTPIGEIHGCVVQWWNPHKIGGAGWQNISPADSWLSCVVLEHECGIRFTTELPPYILLAQLKTDPKKPIVRVVATVTSDTRISHTATRRPTSVNADDVELAMQMARSFQCRLVARAGEHASQFTGGAYAAAEADGRQAMRDFGDAIRDAWDFADVSGTVTIEGLDRPQYRLGAVVQAVAGRGIFLTATRGSTASLRFPQIVGITYLPQQQKQVISLQNFRDTETYIAGLLQSAAATGT